MAAPIKRKTRPQGDQEMVHRQSGFLGGMNTNLPASSISSTELPLIENMVPLRQGLRVRNPMRIVAGNYTLRGTKCVLPLASGQILFFFADGFIYSGYYDGQNALIPDGDYTKLIPATPFNWTVNTDVVAIEYDRKVWVLSNGVLRSIELGSDGKLATGYTTVIRSSKDIEEPTAQLIPAPAYVGSGFTYKTIITPAQIDPVTGLLLSEGPPISLPDYADETAVVETSAAAGYLNPFKPTAWPTGITINALGAGYTHLRMYRTKNLESNITTGEAGADPNVFWLFGTYDMVAGTYKWEPNSNLLGSNAAPFDRDLAIGLTTRFRKWMPILSGFSISNGILFGISGSEPNKVTYTTLTTGYLAQAGLYFPGAQELTYKSDVTAVHALADTVAITTRNTTNIVTPDTAINLSGTAYGEYVPLLTSPSREISPNMGIVDSGCVFVRDNTLFARVSDGTVRSFNGQWSEDIFGGTLSQMISQYPNQGQTIAVSQSGEVWLWTGTGAAKNVCINFVNNEKDGIGSSLCTGGNFAQPTREYLRVNVVEIYDSDGLSHLCIVENDGYNILREISTDVLDNDTAMDWSTDGGGYTGKAYYPRIVTREITGTSLNHYVEHERTDVYLQKIPHLGGFTDTGDVTFKLLCNGSPYVEQEIPRSHGDSFAVFSGGNVCNSFQLDITFPPARFFLPEFAVQFRSRDERDLGQSTTMDSVEKVLANATIGLMSRGNDLYPKYTDSTAVWVKPAAPARVPMYATQYDGIQYADGSSLAVGFEEVGSYTTILMAFRSSGNSRVSFVIGDVSAGATGGYVTLNGSGTCQLVVNGTERKTWPARVGKNYLRLWISSSQLRCTLFDANGVDGGEGIALDFYSGNLSRQFGIQSNGLSIEDMRIIPGYEGALVEMATAYVQDIVHARYNYFPSPRYAP